MIKSQKVTFMAIVEEVMYYRFDYKFHIMNTC